MAIADVARHLAWRRRALGMLGFIWRVSSLLPLLWGVLLLFRGILGILYTSYPTAGPSNNIISQAYVVYYMYRLDVWYGVVAVLMLAWICWFDYTTTHVQKIKKLKDKMPPRFTELIDRTLRPLCLRIGIPHSSVNICYASSDLSGYPSVVESKSKVYLIVPKGFIKVLANDSSRAEAMLAHEFGHIVSKDSRLLLTTTACARIMLYVTIPLNVIIAVIIALKFPVGQLTLHPYNVDTLATFYFWTVLNNIPIITLGCFVFRSFRQEAELLADTFACMYSSVDGVESFLDGERQIKPKLSLLSAHPDMDRRRRNAEHCRRLLQKGGLNYQTSPIAKRSPDGVLILICVTVACLAVPWMFWHYYNGKRADMPGIPQLELGGANNITENASLLAAVHAGSSISVTNAIRAGADPNARDTSGTPALWYAAESGNVDIVNALIAARADLSAGNSAGGMPLTVAARMGHADVVHILIAAGTDVNAQTDAGHTALMNAAANGQRDAVLELLKDGANLNLRDDGGKTALRCATVGRHQDIVAILQQAGETE